MGDTQFSESDIRDTLDTQFSESDMFRDSLDTVRSSGDYDDWNIDDWEPDMLAHVDTMFTVHKKIEIAFKTCVTVTINTDKLHMAAVMLGISGDLESDTITIEMTRDEIEALEELSTMG